jgi:hypothetical protein
MSSGMERGLRGVSGRGWCRAHIACYFVYGYLKTRKMTVSNSHQVVVSIEKIG